MTAREKSRPVPLRHLAGNAEIRKLCGNVTRHTIIAWRKLDQDPFPRPVRTLRLSRVELWDTREVRAWYGRRRRAGL